MISEAIILITIVFNIIGIILNGNNLFTGNNPMYLDCAFSIFYVLLWVSLSVYTYIKKERKFSKYMLIYWSMALSVSIIYGIIVMLNSNGTTSGIFSNLSIFSNIIILFEFIFFAPFYGLELLLQFHITKYSIFITVIPMVFTILAIGIFKKLKKST